MTPHKTNHCQSGDVEWVAGISQHHCVTPCVDERAPAGQRNPNPNNPSGHDNTGTSAHMPRHP